MRDHHTSVAPDGVGIPIPSALDREIAGETLMASLRDASGQGREIVVVQGLGFVGAAVAAVLSSTRSEEAPRYEVVGVDLASSAGYWKIARLQAGEFPFDCPDPNLVDMVRQGVLEAGNLHATCYEEVYSLAHVIVVDVPLDVTDRTQSEPNKIDIRWDGFEAALRAIGRRMRGDALVLVETTVPIGTTQFVARDILLQERARRGVTEPLLLAHAYERVMPGPHYANSIRRFWRSFAGIDPASTRRAQAFLSSFIETDQFPTRNLQDPSASELAKLLENSYRASNIALIYEWTLLAEEIGVNLFEIVDSIRVRKGTHDNMRYPGFGVGGYCLTKDSLLAQWALKNFFHSPLELSVTLNALRINYRMPLHSLDLARLIIKGPLAAQTIVICGLCYLPDVPDTRNAPAEVLYDYLLEQGAVARVHDPLVATWPERPHASVTRQLEEALRQCSVAVLAVNHQIYSRMTAAEWRKVLPPGCGLVDAANVLSDEKAGALHAAGHRLMGVGKGHWRKRGYQEYVQT